MIAPRFLPELRKLPDSVLSFPKAIAKVRRHHKRAEMMFAD